MSLNPNSTNIPYTLGRLFAIYEAVQEAANPGINSTIQTSILVLPLLLRESFSPFWTTCAKSICGSWNPDIGFSTTVKLGKSKLSWEKPTPCG